MSTKTADDAVMSEAARRACERAIVTLRPYEDQPGVSALVSKIRGSAGLTDDPTDILATRKADDIQKADSTLSRFDAMRRAMRDPTVQAAFAAQR